MQFTDASFQPDPVIVRITGIKDYINNPHSPEITLSNEPVRGNFASEIKQLQSEEVVVEEVRRQTQQFTRRRFRDAQETSRMLEQALIDGYTQSISPAAARMLQLLVGDESMQYRFVNSHTSAVPTIVTPVFSYNAATGVFSITGNYFLQHLTLGVDMSSTHAASEYMWWSVQAYTSAVLDDPDKRYYVYLKCSRTSGTSAVYILSETAIGMTAVTGYYHFLVGILNSEYDKSRSFTSLYGFTEIAGARITTDKIVSSDGNTYFDLAQGEIGGKITFAQGTSGLQNIQEWSSFYTGLQSELQNIQDQLDGVVETWYYSGEPTLNNLPASQWATDTEREKHVGDLYYDKDTGKAYRFMHDSDAQTYIWVALADADIARALATAAAAQDTADSKRRVFVAQPTNAQPYDVGDMWVNATYGNLYSNDVLRCITAKAAGATFNIAHWQLASKYTDDTAVLALADKLNDDDTFTVVEKRAVRDTLKQLSNNESSYAVLYAVTAEETTMGNDWDTETDTTSIFYGWKRSNLHTHNSATVVRITVKAYSACQMTVKIGSRAEGNYDYTLLGKLDNTGIVNETGTIDASKVAADTKGARQGNVVQHTFTLQAGTHTFEIAYRKDISTSTQPDNGYYYIQYFPINKGTLYTALESCRAAGLTDRMDSIITAANTLFQYASGAGSVWVDEDTELADGVSFRNTLVGYCSTVLSLIAVAAEEVASTKAVSAEDSAKNNIAQNLGYASWEDMVDKATHEQTIIKGGYLRSTLIDVINLVVQNITSKDGKFRTLEDGTVKAVDGEFAGKVIASSGEIGGFSISDGLQAQDDAGNSVRLNSSSIYFDADKLGSLSTGTGYVKVGAGAIDPTWGSYVGCLSCVIDNASRLGADTNIGIYIRIDGSNSVNNALYVEKGVFAGLRPKTRVISTDVTLSKMWYNLVFITQRTEAERKTITLPESPEEGQTYELLNVNGSYFTLNGNGKTIWVVYNAASGTSVNLGGTRGCWRLIYANTYWYALLYNYQS
ncbi:MAG: hypothetical protein MJY71_02380 [Bacteroidaceae bacterium]|nr:hypothetical protein [Bacteroidaceae bacterium]